MNVKITILLTILPFLSFSQEFTRKTFEYEKLKSENFESCSDKINKDLEKSLIAIKQNNSKLAVNNAINIYNISKDCYQIYDVYAYSLFRNGKWFEGIEIIEEGIRKFGSVPELIKRKSEMSIEMAQLGTGQKNIDGNSVYKSNSIDFDEEQFIIKNYKSALLDLEYLMINYNRNEEIFYVAKIHQILKEYSKSTEAFNRLLNVDEFKHEAIFNIAENYISQNKLSEAETQLNNILTDTPKSGIVFEKLAKIYDKKNDSNIAKEYKKKAVYFNNIPTFSEMEYSENNYELLVFFGTNEHQANEKISKLNTIHKQNKNDFTIDVCLMILKLHANHGNGVEERATEILGIIGKPAIEKVNKLFLLDVSTCTVTNLADVMAKVKDENSWELMKQYLPYIANMPMTLIPPNLPEKMIQFKEDEGITEILKVIKPLLIKKEDGNNPTTELIEFGQYVYYSPLKKINKKKLKKISKKLNYSDKEFKLLEEKIK